MAESTGGASAPESSAAAPLPSRGYRMWLFWACFVALVATSFGFIIRAFTVNAWAIEYGLSETQKGEIQGAGLWPFAISIIGFSLIVDRVGYGRAMVFAFVCHAGSALITIFAPDHMDAYWALYLGQFVVALANGTVEAVINPVVAAMFPKEKTKWLAILHAGWPAGFVLGGLIMMGMDATVEGPGEAAWEYKVALILIPTVIYGAMMVGRHFPQSERVTSGVSYRAMCREAGILGMFIALFLIVSELMRVGSTMWPTLTGADGTLYEIWGLGAWDVRGVNLAITVALLIPFGVYVKGALGHWMFIVTLLLMIPLAITELGTDAWIKDLMEPAMAQFGETFFGTPLSGGWVLIYSSALMMAVRFAAGPISRFTGPLGLLVISSAAAAVGVAMLSFATGLLILLVATIYALGQAFFWPCILGFVAERFPRGGALTLNTVAGVGMLGVGVIGTVLLGNVQDTQIDADLAARDAALHARVVEDEPRFSVFGIYRALDSEAVAALPREEVEMVEAVRDDAKQNALWKVAILPAVACVGFVLLILYFRARGGYKPVDLAGGQIQLE